VLIGIGLIITLLLGGVITALYFLLADAEMSADDAPPPTMPTVSLRSHEERDEFALEADVGSLTYRSSPGETLTPEERAAMDAAVARGVKYLRSHLPGLLQRGTSAGHYNHVGEIALVGLTLLECDLPPQDPDVQSAARRVREAAPALTNTYAISTSVLFLDRLGEQADHPLIHTLCLRLMAGQTRRGGWDYDCPALTAAEEQALSRALRELPSPEELGRAHKLSGGKPDHPTTPDPRLAALPPRLRASAVLNYHPSRRVAQEPASGRADNSNTQFAVLALWAGQRHGVPADRSFALADDRFRSSQQKDGSWGYTFGSRSRPQTMTCSGLLALAAAKGKSLAALYDPKGELPPNADPAIQLGLQFIHDCLHKHMNAGKATLDLKNQDALGDFYFLWSVERVGILYELPRLGGGDWYAWGCRVLLARQQKDGGWRSHWPGPDTCFALLFLRRVNVVSDLTDKLKQLGLPATLRGP